ncbi:MAG: membrane protein insertase YidC [Proteobacteria bacterium]|nr:membrane protein insertase YidC [Pseudomonadota bacterium]
MVKYLNNGSSGFQQYMSAKESEKKSNITTGVLWLAMILLAAWLAYTWLTPKPAVNNPSPAEPASAAENISDVPAQKLRGGDINAKLQGLRISDISLMHYQQEKGGAEPVRLLSGDKEFLEVGMLANGTAAPTAGTVWRSELLKNDLGPEILRMTWKNSEGYEFVRDITVTGYVINVTDTVANHSGRDASVTPYARIVRAAPAKQSSTVAAGAIAFVDDGIERESWQRMTKKSYAYDGPGGYVGFEDQYWQTIARIGGEDQTMHMKMRADELFQADTAAATAVNIRAGETKSFSAKIYAGPKTPGDLKSAAAAIPGIERTIDYGWFWFLARPLLWAINALFDFVGNYGIAIIILTILLRIAMWPLTRKSYTSMAAMQKMQPEMQRIQKLYANDKIRMQAEMTKLYQTHKTSPVSGCLPMLLQIPIFFALYRALLISVPMRQAGFLWIPDLAAADPTSVFNLFGLLPYSVPGWLTIGALPIIMGLTMWWQQKLQSPANGAAPSDPTNPIAQTTKFMKWLPILFVLLFAWMPAGLVLYWTASNLFGIGQMWWIKRQEKKSK